MRGGVVAGFTEPGWRPLGWRGLTGFSEPDDNGGGAQRAGRPGTTDRRQLTCPFIPSSEVLLEGFKKDMKAGGDIPIWNQVRCDQRSSSYF